jgi:hypothetical protein
MKSSKRLTTQLLAASLIFVAACNGKKSDVVEQPTKPAKQGLEPQIHEDKLEACYSTFLKSNPKKDEGTILVRWELNKTGKINTTKLVESELEDKKFTGCVIENLKLAQFPVTATYPSSVAHKYSFKRRSPASL